MTERENHIDLVQIARLVDASIEYAAVLDAAMSGADTDVEIGLRNVADDISDRLIQARIIFRKLGIIPANEPI